MLPIRTEGRAASGTSELESSVRLRLSGHVRDFRIMVAAGGVILRGHAQTYYAKQLAQQAVMKATDLPILANEIDVS
jgi:osmotically-inducible protein OsmY